MCKLIAKYNLLRKTSQRGKTNFHKNLIIVIPKVNYAIMFFICLFIIYSCNIRIQSIIITIYLSQREISQISFHKKQKKLFKN